MEYQQIVYSVRERVATVALNRADKLNAWTLRMEEEVEHAIGQAAGDPEIRAIVLIGTRADSVQEPT